MSYTAKIKSIYERSGVFGKVGSSDSRPNIPPSKKLMQDAIRDGLMLLELDYDSALDQATVTVLMNSKTPSASKSTVKFKVVRFWDLIREGIEKQLE
jgi:hypothetical protein